MPDISLENLSDTELEAELRKRIEDRMKARNGFLIHFVIYIGINLFLWMIYLMTAPGGFMWPLFSMIPWGLAVTIHGYVVYHNSSTAVARRQERINREVALEKMRLGLSEKPKRASAMRLSDDGELIVNEEPDAKVKRNTV